jgi:hypothetical protein
MKKIIAPVFLLALASCNFSPEKMAKDYCNCRADIGSGKKTAEDCQELAESQYLKMQENEEALKTYTEKVLDCMSSTEIRQK